jgi:hypothetical protein
LHRIVRRRPSPATVISLIALFVALGGTSYAAFKIPKNSVGSPQVINGSLQKADLSKKTVAALKGNPGAQGPQGPEGPQGSRGAAGAAGPAGAAGTARAYAEVDSTTPSLVTARTKNISAVTRPATGTYCLTPAAGVDPRTVATAATVDFALSTEDGFVQVTGTGVDCPAGQFEVQTDDIDGDLADTISFHLIVP